MSLNKLWNSKYLIQNIKKSRTAIILFFVLVPIFTSLILITAGSEAYDFATIAGVNIAGLYIIPFIFSACLFGYIYKKNSVDFIGSMPISRKCIFVTNTIGGIILIVLMQLITLILSLIISSLTNSVLFLNMAWDVFVYQSIAYIFVFTIANLAMTLSGTAVAQIALTLLIAFIVPFSSWYVNVMTYEINGQTGYMLMNENVELIEVDKVANYTAPFLVAYTNAYGYNILSMVKMIVLSIIYFAIGLYLFKKKKMEAANESFENKYMHLIIKGLTLIPFVALFKSVAEYDEETLAIIIFAIIVVYYFIFDLITGKRIKISENIIAFIISVATLYGVFSGAIGINKKIDRKIDLNSIKEVTFSVDHKFYTKAADKDKVKSAIIALAQSGNSHPSYYDNYEDNINYRVDVELIDNCGTKYTEDFYLNKKVLSKIFDESYKNIELSDNAVISNHNLDLTKEEVNEIYKEVHDSLKNTTMKDILSGEKSIYYLSVDFNEYRNHNLIEISYPVILNKKIENILISAYNRRAVHYLQNGFHDTYYMVDAFGEFDDDTMEKVLFATGQGNEELFANFILSNADNVPKDVTKCIRISTMKFEFYTDKIEEFLEMINKYCEENKEQFEYYMGGV